LSNDSSYFNSLPNKVQSRILKKPRSSQQSRSLMIPRHPRTQIQNPHYVSSAAMTLGLWMARRKGRLTIRSSENEFEAGSVQIRQRRDPQELKIYIKQLSKALKFLPLGSRAYYAVTGELLRASTQLRALIPAGAPSKSEH
jgi:hypothetical protein